MYKNPIKHSIETMMPRLNIKNPTQLGELAGVSQSIISRILDGTHQTMALHNCQKLAMALGITTDQLTGLEQLPAIQACDGGAPYENEIETTAPLTTSRIVPLVGEVKGGADGFLDETQYPVGHGEGYIEFSTRDPHAYALRVRGDSMHPRYMAGEFVIVEPSRAPQPGEDVIVGMNDGRKMIKRLNWIRDDEAQLVSVNDGYQPLTVLLADIEFMHYAPGRATRSCLRKG